MTTPMTDRAIREISETPEKRCSKCKQFKSRSEFNKDRSEKDGLSCQCKVCRKVGQKVYQTRHRDKILARRKGYRRGHREEIKAYQADHLEEYAANSRAYRDTFRGYLHSRWCGLVTRCTNPKNTSYDRYGRAGIECHFSFDSFFNHVVNDLGFDTVESLNELDVHRIDNKHYRIGNIVFLSRAEHMATHKLLREQAGVVLERSG